MDAKTKIHIFKENHEIKNGKLIQPLESPAKLFANLLFGFNRTSKVKTILRLKFSTRNDEDKKALK